MHPCIRVYGICIMHPCIRGMHHASMHKGDGICIGGGDMQRFKRFSKKIYKVISKNIYIDYMFSKSSQKRFTKSELSRSPTSVTILHDCI